jgi:hypothetical protein
MLDFLRKHPKEHGVLVAAATDTSALGALQAVREAKRERAAAIVGQDCIPEPLDELELPGSCSIVRFPRGPKLRPALHPIGAGDPERPSGAAVQLREAQVGTVERTLEKNARHQVACNRAFHY